MLRTMSADPGIEVASKADESASIQFGVLLQRVAGLELPVAEMPAPNTTAKHSSKVSRRRPIEERYLAGRFTFTAELEMLTRLAADSSVTCHEAFIATVGLFARRYANDGVFQLGFQFRDNSGAFTGERSPIKRCLVDPRESCSIRGFVRSAQQAITIADRWSDFREDWRDLVRDVPLQVAASVPSRGSGGEISEPATAFGSQLTRMAEPADPIIWFVLELGSDSEHASLLILVSRQNRLLISLDRLFDQYRDLIERAVDAPDAAVESVGGPSVKEENLLLGTWAGKSDVNQSHDSFLALFHRQVLRCPEAIALLWRNERFTYSALMARVGRIAALLSAHGVQRGDVVAVCLERSPELIASLIAIFELGAAYVPIDPAYPEERQRYIIRDSRSKAVLTARGSAKHLLPDLPSAIFIDDMSNGSAMPAPSVACPNPEPSDAAYIIYTSGSTGNPKGVVLEQRNLSAFLSWAADLFDQSDLAGVLASTSICFDLSVFEIFLPLSQGGTMILCRNVLEIFELPTRDLITLINTVPSAMAALLRLEALPSSVRTVNLAGEAFPGRLAEALAASRSIERAFNLYGPTEATVYSTVAQVDLRHPTAPPIGRPITGTQVYVLDSNLRPCPIGVPGELYLGGAGLARGYLNNQRATEERFIRNPFGGLGSRLYRTGDRARYNEDGELEFLGRTDHQVKIRGFRIELDEISSLLESERGVRQAVPIVVPGPDGDPRLVAYIVAEDSAKPPRPERIRRTLQNHLPSYMVPDAYRIISAVPLTPNGKLDRKALPAIDWQKDGNAGSPETTVGDDERQVAHSFADEISHSLSRIWAELLGIDEELINAKAHFLRLGGHSLLAVQAIARIRNTFGIALSLREFLHHLEFAAMCELLHMARRRKKPDKQAVVSSDALVVSYAQQRFWFLDQLEPRSNSYNLAGVIWIRGQLDFPRFRAALDRVVLRHNVLRTAFGSVEGVPHPTVLPAADIKIELRAIDVFESRARCVASAEKIAREQAAKLADPPFDLARPPLVRFGLAQLAQDRYALLFATHHIVFDGWSFEVLTRDLAHAYRSGDGDARTPCAAEGLQYSDFAAWQRGPDQRLSQNMMIDFFRRMLRDAPAIFEPPIAGQGNLTPDARTSETYPIDVALFDELKAFAHAMNTTPFVPLLVAFGISLNYHYGDSDLVIGSAFAARSRSEFENLIGCFANTLPIRLKVDRALCFRELVRRARDTVIEVHERQDLPFDRLVESLKPQRVHGRNPLFQIAFGIENAPSTRQENDNVTLTWEEIELDRSRLDLTVWIAEKGAQVSARWRWNPQLFSEDSVSSVNSSWLQGLAEALKEPDSPLRELSGAGCNAHIVRKGGQIAGIEHL